MIVKVYWSIWAFVLLLAGALFVAGQFTDVTAVFFGFVVFGLVFMGMMSVLPATIIHSELHQRKTEKVAEVRHRSEKIVTAGKSYLTDWLSPEDSSISQPHYHRNGPISAGK
jgi:hypothetical protein